LECPAQKFQYLPKTSNRKERELIIAKWIILGFRFGGKRGDRFISLKIKLKALPTPKNQHLRLCQYRARIAMYQGIGSPV
jgi:hypothetical protein